MKSPVLMLVMFCLAFLTGCAGTHFVRVKDDALMLGQTTPEQIISRLGAPDKQNTVRVNEQQVKTISYIYVGLPDEPDAFGVYAGRKQEFDFFDNKLVGYFFTSSYKKDSTNFDISKAAQIAKGVSTRADVVRLLGNPAGKSIYPVTPNSDEEATTYSYYRITHPMFKGVVQYRKLLVITFNKQGVVTNVESFESGQE